MFHPVRIESSAEPHTFEVLGNGCWHYNYDILAEDITAYDKYEDVTKSLTLYSFIQIRMAGQPDYKRCVEEVIRAHLTQSQEFDLINSYNRVQFGQLSEEDAVKARAEYTEYLELLAKIKAKVRADFNTREAELNARRARLRYGHPSNED